MKKSRRILSFVLITVLFVSMAIPSSAASYEWTENGVTNRATVTKQGNAYVIKVPIKDATVVQHVYGQQEVISWPAGYRVEYGAVSFTSVSSLYGLQLNLAARREGLVVDKMYSNIPTFDYYVLSADLPTGTYSFGSEITVYDVSWSVALDVPGALRALVLPESPMSGTLEAVPVSMTAVKLIQIS